jgi:mannose-1-phosphate guanylyltransferase / phosphomannomutase
MIAGILAGGKGTRLGELAAGLPKPMVTCEGKPLLQYHIELLKKYGITRIILLVGYKAEIIQRYFGDGSKFGVSLSYSFETEPLGTAGAVKNAEALFQDTFVLLYGDVMIDMDLGRMIDFHERNRGMATLAVHPNSHPYDSDLLEIDDKGLVTGFFPKPHSGDAWLQNLVNAGAYILSPEIMSHLTSGLSDFGKDVFPRLMRDKKQLYGYLTSEYIKDMGTPERLAVVRNDILSGKTAARNLQNKQCAIFLDRDGVINRHIDQVHRAEDIELLPHVAEAIRMINDSSFISIVITNQPAVARGLCDMAEIKRMHNRIDTLLGADRAFIDCYYFCPHHPDSGYPGENRALKIACTCRKPKTGMIDEACRKFNIDLTRSYFIGDTWRDIQTGKNAGTKTILLGTGCVESDAKHRVEPDFYATDLLSAVKNIFSQEHCAAGKQVSK